MVGAGVIALVAGPASGEPATISANRAEVSRIQGELREIDSRVEHAVEAYNGARYELTQITARIRQNRREISRTQDRLDASRDILATRLRDVYANPQLDLVAVVITSGSLSGAIQQTDVLERIAQRDDSVVRRVRASKVRLQGARAQLEADEKATRRELAEREAQRERVEALPVVDGVEAGEHPPSVTAGAR